MRKKAYTLMEILISLGIIGIIAMILVRLISGATPNTNKVGFLRAYVTTQSVVADMINDKSIYPDEYSRTDNSKYGFANTEPPTYGYYAIHGGPQMSGSNKFGLIFLDKLGYSAANYGTLHPRDNVVYTVQGQTITIKNKKDEVLGSFIVDNEGKITCQSGDLPDVTCENITELRNRDTE